MRSLAVVLSQLVIACEGPVGPKDLQVHKAPGVYGVQLVRMVPRVHKGRRGNSWTGCSKYVCGRP